MSFFPFFYLRGKRSLSVCLSLSFCLPFFSPFSLVSLLSFIASVSTSPLSTFVFHTFPVLLSHLCNHPPEVLLVLLLPTLKSFLYLYSQPSLHVQVATHPSWGQQSCSWLLVFSQNILFYIQLLNYFLYNIQSNHNIAMLKKLSRVPHILWSKVQSSKP